MQETGSFFWVANAFSVFLKRKVGMVYFPYVLFLGDSPHPFQPFCIAPGLTGGNMSKCSTYRGTVFHFLVVPVFALLKRRGDFCGLIVRAYPEYTDGVRNKLSIGFAATVPKTS